VKSSHEAVTRCGQQVREEAAGRRAPVRENEARHVLARYIDCGGSKGRTHR